MLSASMPPSAVDAVKSANSGTNPHRLTTPRTCPTTSTSTTKTCATTTSLTPTIAPYRRRVSFDNYQPEAIPPPLLLENTYNIPTCRAQAHLNPIPSSSNSGAPPAPILKNKTKPQSQSQFQSAGSLSGNSSPLLSNAATTGSNSGTTSIGTNTNKHTNNASHNYSLQPPNTSGNIRKKSYSEMSDNELLALDAQFNVRSVDIQKSYGFDVTPRLSTSAISNSDKDSMSFGSGPGDFRNLSRNLMLHEYPTKPIIRKNSICVNFKHASLSNTDLNDKFYLIVLTNKSSSLSCFNYYLEKIASKGDTIVISCSLSTSILGNDKNDALDSFISEFTSHILNHLTTSKPINITFEFFKSFSYINEVMNLYQPSLILIGSDTETTKSTFITTPNRKLVSVVHVGNDYCKPHHQRSIVSSNDALDVTASSSPPKPTINFKIPFTDNEKRIEKEKHMTSIPSIIIDDENSSTQAFDPSGTDSATTTPTSVDYVVNSNRLSKMKTNDTLASSLFDNLIETPFFDLTKTSTSSSATTTTTNTSNDGYRRKSMLDVLNSDPKIKRGSVGSSGGGDDCAIKDDDDDDDDAGISNAHGVRMDRRKSNVSSNSTELSTLTKTTSPQQKGPLIGHEKERQDLFEKYQRRLSSVNVTPQNEQPVTTEKAKTGSRKLFKWFGK
jgi:hypothetical protein